MLEFGKLAYVRRQYACDGRVVLKLQERKFSEIIVAFMDGPAQPVISNSFD